MRRIRASVAVISAVLLLSAFPSMASAILPPCGCGGYTFSAYSNWDGFASESESYWCVPASSVTWVNQITGGTTVSRTRQSNFFDYGWSKNKYDYNDVGFGVDPRGWAWLMFNKTPAGYTYNDYVYGNQGTANNEIVANVYETDEPVGILVARGRHAILVAGFASSKSPSLSGWDLYGFYVVDPWYPRADITLAGGTYGLDPMTYIAESTWNQSYFQRYDNEYSEGDYGSPVNTHYDTIWDGSYTLVLRKSSTTEAPTGPSVAAPPWADTHSGVAGAASLLGRDDGYPTVEEAVAAGVQKNKLAKDNGLGVALAGVSVGDKILVDSLENGTSDYYLATLERAGQPVALAMVEVRGTSYSLGAVTRVHPTFRLPTASDAARVLGAPTANIQAVWRSSAISPTPFEPAWVASSTAGGKAVTMNGLSRPMP